MRCDVISIFPNIFAAIKDYGVAGRAVTNNLLDLKIWDLRNYTESKHGNVDARPYGGGPGMLMQVQPLKSALDTIKHDRGITDDNSKVIYLSPQGKKITSQLLENFVKSGSQPIFIAGRYEGVDERFIESSVDEQWSIGDYVLSGGELAIMVALDAMARFIPGVLNNKESSEQDSFSDGLLDHPHYTKPSEIMGQKVPEVLLSGDHGKIARWRLKQRLGRTKLYRPDLLDNLALTQEQHELLQEFMRELGDNNE